MRSAVLVVFLGLTGAACAGSNPQPLAPPRPAPAATPAVKDQLTSRRLAIRVRQHGQFVPARLTERGDGGSAEFQLERDTFELLVPHLGGLPIGLIVWKADDVLSLQGTRDDCGHPPFYAGTGMAVAGAPVTYFLLDRCGMNYFTGERFAGTDTGHSVIRIGAFRADGSEIPLADYGEELFISAYRNLRSVGGTIGNSFDFVVLRFP